MLFDRHPVPSRQRSAGRLLVLIALLTLPLAIFGAQTAESNDVPAHSKRIIGATATFTEMQSGLNFKARIDTGAASCSLHIAKIEIEDESKIRSQNVGKTAHIWLKNAAGETARIKAKIAQTVRVKSSSLGPGGFDRRYKVRLTLRWKDFQKDVLVTLNDRTDMEYPLLIGRNYLEGDFLVDVSKDT